MANIDLGKILKEQQEFLAEARHRLEAVRDAQSGKLTPQTLVATKEAQLAQAKLRLDEATQSRDRAVARYEVTLSRRREEIQLLEKELDELRGHEGRIKNRDVKQPPVREINGVGDKYQELLEATGITTIGRLAQMKTAKLAEVLSTSEERAETILKAARAKLEE